MNIFMNLPDRYAQLKSLSTGQDVPGSIHGSAVIFFYSEQLLHSMYELGLSVFQIFLFKLYSVLFSEEAPSLCSSQQGKVL